MISYELLILIGSLIMIGISILLWVYSKGKLGIIFLGALIFILGIASISHSISSRSFFVKFPHFFGISTCLITLYFPLMFFYVKTFLFEESRKIKYYLIHIIPFFLVVISFSPFFFQSGQEKSTLIELGLPIWMSTVFIFKDIYLILSGVFYSLLSFLAIIEFKRNYDNKLSNLAITSLKWLRIFISLNLFLFVIRLMGESFEVLKIKFPVDLIEGYFIFQCVIYIVIGTLALLYRNFFNSIDKIEFEEVQIDINVPVVLLEDQEPVLKNEKGNIKFEDENDENEKDVKMMISFLEESKSFLNKDMTLQSFADDIGLPKHRVTKLLNTTIESNFNDFINEYRVNEVIRLINEGKHEQHKLLYLAELSGFNSKSSFNRAFKKVMGKTPSEYIQ